MKHGSTIFLRLAIMGMGLLVLIFCFFVLPAIYSGWAAEYPDLAGWRYPILIGLGTTAVAFFFALWQGLRILDYIDKNTAFSELSAKALSNIKYAGLVIGGIYGLGLPVIYSMAQAEDAPGLVVIGMIFTAAPITVAVFAALMQHLVQNAIDLKKENDLTV